MRKGRYIPKDWKEKEYHPEDWKNIGYEKYCHYVQNIKTGEKVFISMCWSTVHSNDMRDCTCRKPVTYYDKKSIADLKEEINYLRSKLEENNIKY